MNTKHPKSKKKTVKKKLGVAELKKLLGCESMPVGVAILA